LTFFNVLGDYFISQKNGHVGLLQKEDIC